MKRCWIAIIAIVLPVAALGKRLPPSPQTAVSGSGPGCFATLQEAVDASSDGDRIEAEADLLGGVVVNVDVQIVGQGSGLTTISGGGPVLTIGKFRAKHEPEVVIEGVTITDGETRSSGTSEPFVGEEGVIAAGGGIEVLPDKHFNGRAKLKVVDSVISGNRVAPEQSLPIGPECPGGDPCPFAMASGGGIETWDG